MVTRSDSKLRPILVALAAATLLAVVPLSAGAISVPLDLADAPLGEDGAVVDEPAHEGELDFSQAVWPVESQNDRGVDVRAVQFLLLYRGYSAPTDGVFGSSTTTAVKSFQTSRGLGADGIVGANTWSALVPPLSRGANNNAVKALQLELNAKRGAGLVVDGAFGAATETAVRNFQSHAGIGIDGIVGPTTWKNLVWHYMQPANTAYQCVVPPTSETWGTGDTIGLLGHAANLFGPLGYGKLASNDISLEHGGYFPPHSSHRDGMSVDMRLIRTDATQCSNPCTMTQSCFSATRTLSLCRKLRDAAPGHVSAIYMNSATLINAGCSTYLSGHDDHLHITYR